MTLNGTHPLLALVGTTASGKSYVAMELAKSVTGLEIISVDSMQIYRGMDVGTAKPSDPQHSKSDNRTRTSNNGI